LPSFGKEGADRSRRVFFFKISWNFSPSSTSKQSNKKFRGEIYHVSQ